MKKVLFNTVFLLTGLLFISSSFAQEKERTEPKFKKNKTYSKSYNLGSSDKISLSNQFGEMKLVTWDKNEIKVDVSITGKSDDEKRAQEIVDKISIEDGKSGNTVSFKTKFADRNNNWNGDNDGKHEKGDKKEHHNEGMEVNYLVYLPSGNTLNAENQFGKMIVPDYRGEATLSCKFGSLTAGKISNANEINVEFGNADITHMNGGDLSIKFSNATINKLSGDVKSDLQFSKVKLVFDNDAKNLTINNSYSEVYLDVDKSFSASWDIHTSHGSFSNKSDFPIKEQGDDDRQYGPKFSSSFKGVSGGGAAKVRVNSSFGEIIVGHNLQVDMTEKKKSKSKNKTTQI